MLPESDYNTVLVAASAGGGPITRVLGEFYHRPRKVGANRLSQAFNRLVGFSGYGCSQAQVLNAMLGIADMMDGILRVEEGRHSRAHGLSRDAEEVVTHLFHYLSQADHLRGGRVAEV